MNYYQILVQTQLPSITLLYKSTQNLPIGQLVEVEVRKRKIRGIVWNTEQKQHYHFEIKEIKKILPYIFNQAHIKFLKYFAVHSFNSINLILDAMLKPFDKYTSKDWNLLNTKYLKQASKPFLQKNSGITSPIELISDSELWVRIIYIIRSIDNHSNKIFLLLFPEKKELENYFTQFNQQFLNDVDFVAYKYPNSISIEKTISQSIILNNQNISNSPKFIFALRSGIFLPFESLSQVFLIDESSNMYIQEQNQIYFDTREAVYYLANSYFSKVAFVSNLPSLRMYNYDQQAVQNILKLN